jgi:poly(A) polymerase
MGEPIADIDLATTLTPDAVIEALAAAGLKAVPTGLEHGTVTAVSQGAPYEITTLRRDVSTDGRRAVVAFTEDWTEDAQRRDFRFNALYADRAGLIFDPTGEGVADAKARRVVFVGDAATRIREDYLRILRYFRFLAWYGQGDHDPAAIDACTALRHGMATLAAERVSTELLKLLAAPDPRDAVRLMARAGVLEQVLPHAASLERLEGLVGIEDEPLVGRDRDLRLAALMHGEAADLRAATQALRLSNALRDRLIATASDGHAFDAAMSPQMARAALFCLGVQAFADRVKLAWASDHASGSAASWRALLALAEGWVSPVLPVGGDDALTAGATGRAVGEALKSVEAWWIDRDFQASRDEALDRLRAVVAGQ